MYDVNLDSDPTGFSQSVSYTMRIINDTETNESAVQFAYTDLDELTESVQFRVYADRLNGTLIYESDVYHNTSEIGSLIVPLTGYENRTVVGDIEIVHAEAGTQHASKLLNKDWGIGMGLQDHVSQEFLNWFFIILLSVVAIMSSIKTSMSALVVTALAFVFMLFGWMAISGGVLALAILISLLDFLAKRKGR